MTKHWRQLIGIATGIAITPIAIAFAAESGGGGHGDYLLAKLLYPYTMLLTRVADDTITYPLIGLAFLQFPLYGLAASSFNTPRSIAVIAFIHVACAGLCFTALLPTFS